MVISFIYLLPWFRCVRTSTNGRNVVGLTIVQVLHPDERNNFWMRNFRRSRVFGGKWRRPCFERAETGGSRGSGHECEKSNIEGKCVEGC